jgi:hypothetical protein
MRSRGAGGTKEFIRKIQQKKIDLLCFRCLNGAFFLVYLISFFYHVLDCDIFLGVLILVSLQYYFPILLSRKISYM